MLSSVAALATHASVSLLVTLLRVGVQLFQLAAIALLALTLGCLRRARRFAFSWLAWPCPAALRRRYAQRALQRRLDAATTLREYECLAAELDEATGEAAWRAAPSSEGMGCDAHLLELTASRLRAARARGDVGLIMFSLRGVVVRRFAGIDDGRLWRVARCGTKHFVESFQAEVCACLDVIAASPELPPAARSLYFEALRRSFGRTALCLSGGGALALAHLGVLRVLLTEGLMPRVISGCSGGAIIAAFAAIYGDAECLERFLVPSVISRLSVTFFEPLSHQLATLALSSLTGAPRMVEPERFAATLRALYGDATFATAFAATGRIVCISVTTGSQGASPSNLLLTYLTTPDVLLWSAVAASCALPGLMRPVELKALDHDGRTVAYHAGGVTSIDGSMAADIPHEQLALLFGCNA